uniref:Uncharacterized protein n=1 Tax=Cacopsylla melanoneura TaxID=428564 RepID=A0A8D8RVU9_9HEMI
MQSFCMLYLSLTVHLIPDVCLWMSYILRRYTYREYRVILKSHPGVSKIVKHFQPHHKELTNVVVVVLLLVVNLRFPVPFELTCCRHLHKPPQHCLKTSPRFPDSFVDVPNTEG